MDSIFELKITLRQWLISSACFGVFIYLIQIVTFIENKCCTLNKNCLRKMAIITTILTQFKIGFYNFLGIYLFYSIKDRDLATC
jgi:hypothetical protein